MDMLSVNSLRPRRNGRHFADDIFKCIFLNENDWIPIKISLKFVSSGTINNIPALVRIMAWRRPGDKPLSEPMMVRLPTHICVTRPQWVKMMRSQIRYIRMRFCYNNSPKVVKIFVNPVDVHHKQKHHHCMNSIYTCCGKSVASFKYLTWLNGAFSAIIPRVSNEWWPLSRLNQWICVHLTSAGPHQMLMHI